MGKLLDGLIYATPFVIAAYLVIQHFLKKNYEKILNESAKKAAPVYAILDILESAQQASIKPVKFRQLYLVMSALFGILMKGSTTFKAM